MKKKAEQPTPWFFGSEEYEKVSEPTKKSKAFAWTTAVFAIKYLRFLGWNNVNNKPFAENSWYFRNALVRANYNSSSKGISGDSTFLIQFFRNLLLGEHNELKKRYMHIYWNGEQNPTVNKLDAKIIEEMKKNPKITYSELAKIASKNRDTIAVHIKKMTEAGLIKRIGADKNGSWVVK